MQKPFPLLSRHPGAAGRYGVLVVLLCWLFFPMGLPAATVDGLFQTEVPVQGRDTAQRSQAIQQALAQVLVKVSGYQDIPRRAELEEELAQASRYVQQYRYLTTDQTGAQPAERLQVQFDGAAVTRLLREHGLPVWGEVRPVVLIWLALETQGARRWYAPDTDPAGWDALQRAADDRGLPLLLPLLDLEDQTRLRAGELWGGLESTIRTASDRYAPDAILIGTLTDLGSAWRVDWTLLQDDVVSRQGAPSGLDESLAAGIHWAADTIAARYVPWGTESRARWLELRVANIYELVDYTRVQAHLDSLSAVAQSRLLAVEPGVARFRLRVTGGAAALERGMALGGLLEPDPHPLSGPGGAAGDSSAQVRAGVLSYRIRP